MFYGVPLFFEGEDLRSFTLIFAGFGAFVTSSIGRLIGFGIYQSPSQFPKKKRRLEKNHSSPTAVIHCFEQDVKKLRTLYIGPILADTALA